MPGYSNNPNTIPVRLISRVKTAEEWATIDASNAQDFYLFNGEVGIDSTNGYAFKVGDGVSKFSELPWAIAHSAYSLANSVNISINGISKSFDGTTDLAWSLSELGMASATHNHVISDVTDLFTLLNKKIEPSGLAYTFDDSALISAVKSSLNIT